MKNATITQEGLNKVQKSRNRVLELMGFEPDTTTITAPESDVVIVESNSYDLQEALKDVGTEMQTQSQRTVWAIRDEIKCLRSEIALSDLYDMGDVNAKKIRVQSLMVEYRAAKKLNNSLKKY